MIPLRFFRDKTHVFVNNPSGITKKMSIADFEAMLNGSGGGSGDGGVFNIGIQYDEGGDFTYLTETFDDIAENLKTKVCIINDAFEEDGYVWITQQIVLNASYDEAWETNTVIAATAFINPDAYEKSLLNLTIFYDDAGVMKMASTTSVPPLPTIFVLRSGAIQEAPGKVIGALQSGANVYISDYSAGGNNSIYYTVEGFGNTGSKFYVELSNGIIYSGTASDSTMNEEE